jgi:hypothetical protein
MKLNLSAVAASDTEERQSQGRPMSVDRAGLELLGFIFGGVTAAVMLVACTVVLGQAEGRFAPEVPTAKLVALQ